MFSCRTDLFSLIKFDMYLNSQNIEQEQACVLIEEL